MSKIKILITYKNEHQIIKSNILTPIQTGRAIADKHFPGMIGDDTGDNISQDNPKYNELSAQYWAWKNLDALDNPEYVGFMHYRRHFLFHEPPDLPAQTWMKNAPVYAFPALTKEYLKNLEDKYIKEYFPKYDCLVLKPYNVINLGRKTCREQYVKGIPGAFPEVFDTMIEIVRELYPNYAKDIDEFEGTSIQYLCNMFVMKKSLFIEYCQFLFAVLDGIDKVIVSNRFTTQQMRFLAYMGEFLLTIFLRHIQRRGNISIKELNGSILLDTSVNIEDNPIEPAFKNNYSVIAVSSSSAYAPYLSVYLQAITEHASEHNYDIIVFECDITDEDKNIIQKMYARDNISIRFLNLKSIATTIDVKIEKGVHYRKECTFRLYAPRLLRNYAKIIFTDIDLLFLADVKDLYQLDMNGYLLAACKDFIMAAHCGLTWGRPWKEYLTDTLKLKDTASYFNTGVMLIDIKKINKHNYMQRCLELLADNEYRCLEQDALNLVLQDNIKYLDGAWNVPTLQKQMKDWKFLEAMPFTDLRLYEKLRKKPKVVHYAAHRKPWLYPDEEMAELWWSYARKTPFYERILLKTLSTVPTAFMPDGQAGNSAFGYALNYKKNYWKYLRYKILSNLTFGKRRAHYEKKRKAYKKALQLGRNFLKQALFQNVQ